MALLDDLVSPAQYSTELDKPVLTKLDNLCVYQVTGDDAHSFLQGQFSNDIEMVNETNAQLTSYSTPKGRMLAIFYVCKRSDHYLLITSRDIADDVMKRLQMYVMRSKVVISKLDNEMVLGLSNDTDGTVLKHLNLPKPESDYQTTSVDNLISIQIPGIQSRYLIIGDQASLAELNQISPEIVYVYTSDYWQWLDIMSGIPTVTAATQEAFVPQMANMELINGVSFSKGCYPGQEVVARLHYLGNANRRMFRVEVQSENDLHSGDEIFTSNSNQAVGKFLSVTKVDNAKYAGLAIVRTEAVKDKSLYTAPNDGDTVLIMKLPYQVPIEAKEKNN